jgi:arylsulfatase A-like enzyme
MAQVLAMAAYRSVTGQMVHVSSHVVWMAPLANLALFGLAAVVLLIVTRRLSRPATLGMLWAVFVFLTGLGPAILTQRLHPAASILLLIGIALQTARLVRSRAESIDGLIRRSLPAVLLITVAAGLTQAGLKEFKARQAEASSPAKSATTPNVVLIVLDTVRAASLSLYGYPRGTSSHLDEFATTGAVFEHAMATSSWTLPSHASMFTGRLPHELSADWLTPLDRTHQTLAESFAARGYATGGFVANLLYAAEASGLNRGFTRYSDFPPSIGTVIRQSLLLRPVVNRIRDAMGHTDHLVTKPAGAVTDEFSTWLDGYESTQPFFAFLNYFDAHEPYRSPAPFDMTGGRTPDLSNRRRWTPQEIQQSRDAYDSAITYIDEEVSNVISHLEQRNLLDNTLIVITSDHGEQFGEHGLFDHGNSLYRASLEVPLVIRLPGKVPAGLRVREPVSLIDLSATIMGLTGAPDSASLPGRSLERLWSLPTASKMPVISEISKGINLPPWQPISKGSMRSVVLDGVHYILNGDGSEELYDFERDEAESQNLVERAEMAAKLEAARRAVKR